MATSQESKYIKRATSLLGYYPNSQVGLNNFGVEPFCQFDSLILDPRSLDYNMSPKYEKRRNEEM